MQNIKKFLIVYAHPEPKSFCGSLKNITINNLKKQNQEVLITDLYSQNFNPVISQKDFTQLKNKEYFQYMNEQINSYNNNFEYYSPQIKEELEKIKWADNFIFIFPLWWGSYPAILKGWFDKCLVYGHSWTEKNSFSNGLLKGKTAWSVVTCEDTEENYSPNGKQKIHVEDMLHHFNRASMSFVGAKVYKTHVFYKISSKTYEERQRELVNYENLINNYESMEVMFD